MFHFGLDLLQGNSALGILFKFGQAAIQFGALFRGQIGINPSEFCTKLFPYLLDERTLFVGWHRPHLLDEFCGAHIANLRPRFDGGNGKSFLPMIPREILKKIRQIEIRTNRLVSETLAGQYHSVFKGQGMNFDEVREYQPGDEVRTIDWNVTARMNHPFVKKFVEERELTLMLLVDVSGSGLFGSVEQSKRELAAEIASVLAFSAIRNNDKVGLILFSDEVEKFIPPRKGRKHVLRVIREVLFFEPERRGTDLNGALEFLLRVTRHRAIAVIISDFIGSPATSGKRTGRPRPQIMLLESLAQASFTMLRQVNRRHDVVAVQIADRFELELPALGRLVLTDAETGEVVEVNTGDERKRLDFNQRQTRAQADVARLFRSAGIDAIQLRTDRPYGVELSRFFETRERRRLHG